MGLMIYKATTLKKQNKSPPLFPTGTDILTWGGVGVKKQNKKHLQIEAVKQWDMIKVALVTDLTLKQLFFTLVHCCSSV